MLLYWIDIYLKIPFEGEVPENLINAIEGYLHLLACEHFVSARATAAVALFCYNI